MCGCRAVEPAVISLSTDILRIVRTVGSVSQVFCHPGNSIDGHSRILLAIAGILERARLDLDFYGVAVFVGESQVVGSGAA